MRIASLAGFGAPAKGDLCRVRKAIHTVLAVGILMAVDVAANAAEAWRPSPLKSGLELASRDIQSMQNDDFSNSGMLWVARGEKLWNTGAGRDDKSCADCHGEAAGSMKGVAARYPVVDRGSARLMNVEQRIQQCQTRRQSTTPFAYESDELLSLTAYVRHQSRGLPVRVEIDLNNRTYFERGRALYTRRVGQLNLACTHCHDSNWGRKLGPETISQGHGNAYPIYRLEWQTLGSLQRRFRSCLSGVRAEMLPYGAQEYLDLELYLAWRGNGLSVETPGVRR